MSVLRIASPLCNVPSEIEHHLRPLPDAFIVGAQVTITRCEYVDKDVVEVLVPGVQIGHTGQLISCFLDLAKAINDLYGTSYALASADDRQCL